VNLLLVEIQACVEDTERLQKMLAETKLRNTFEQDKREKTIYALEQDILKLFPYGVVRSTCNRPFHVGDKYVVDGKIIPAPELELPGSPREPKGKKAAETIWRRVSVCSDSLGGTTESIKSESVVFPEVPVLNTFPEVPVLNTGSRHSTPRRSLTPLTKLSPLKMPSWTDSPLLESRILQPNKFARVSTPLDPRLTNLKTPSWTDSPLLSTRITDRLNSSYSENRLLTPTPPTGRSVTNLRATESNPEFQNLNLISPDPPPTPPLISPNPPPTPTLDTGSDTTKNVAVMPVFKNPKLLQTLMKSRLENPIAYNPIQAKNLHLTTEMGSGNNLHVTSQPRLRRPIEVGLGIHKPSPIQSPRIGSSFYRTNQSLLMMGKQDITHQGDKHLTASLPSRIERAIEELRAASSVNVKNSEAQV